jgi:malonyl-CoA O-methyltransferase
MRDRFGRAAASYDSAAVVARETGSRMEQRLEYVRLAPAAIADIGCATGDGVRMLQKRYPAALPLAIDFAHPMLSVVRAHTPFIQRLRGQAARPINADVRALPLARDRVGLVWSNLMLHWLDDPRSAFDEILRVLEVGGLLMFSMLGPDTLKELRAACSTAGIGPPLRRFLDMHDIGDMLLTAGFADPVMDMEMLHLSYRTPRGLLADQRHLGVRNDLLGTMPWRDWRRAFRAYDQCRIDGRLPASFEIIYGHAWKPEPRLSDDGRAIVKVDLTRLRAR